MFWGMSTKSLLTIGVFVSFLVTPVCAESFDYRGYQEKAINQYDMSEYMEKLNKKIEDNWRAPEVMEEGKVSVIFKIDRDGKIIYTEVDKSSGNAVFDESAVNTIKTSAPFPHLPEDSKREYLTLKYNFESSIIKTDTMKKYVENSERYFNVDNKLALKYIDMAIKEIDGNSECFFLYARRYKINKALGDLNSANEDLEKCKKLKKLYDTNRIRTCKQMVANENSAFSYFSLASAYDSAGDYPNAIDAIDKAISMTDLNHSYKRYRAEIIMRSKD